MYSMTPIKLFARADAAIAEAKRLQQHSLDWQYDIFNRIKRMSYRATFEPKTDRVLSPLDFPKPKRDCKPFLNEEE